MAKDFYAFRVNPESDADIIMMMEHADNKTEFVKACIRVARDQIIEKDPRDIGSDSEAISDYQWRFKMFYEILIDTVNGETFKFTATTKDGCYKVFDTYKTFDYVSRITVFTTNKEHQRVLIDVFDGGLAHE